MYGCGRQPQAERPLGRARTRWEISPLKTNRMFYIRTQCLPRCKHSPLRL
jgi:hypothetical protein